MQYLRLVAVGNFVLQKILSDSVISVLCLNSLMDQIDFGLRPATVGIHNGDLDHPPMERVISPRESMLVLEYLQNICIHTDAVNMWTVIPPHHNHFTTVCLGLPR